MRGPNRSCNGWKNGRRDELSEFRPIPMREVEGCAHSREIRGGCSEAAGTAGALASNEGEVNIMTSTHGRIEHLAKATTLHEAIRHAAAVRPAAVAVEDGESSLTYATLIRRAVAFSSQLQSAGIEPGTPVLVGLERDRHACIVLLGILLAGCHYVPVERGWPAKRLCAVAGILNAKTAVLSGRWVQQAAEFHRAIPALETLFLSTEPEDLPLRSPQAWRPVTLRAEESDKSSCCHVPKPLATAYVIFTSGSTGTPKGVEVGHEAPLNLFGWLSKNHALTPHDRVLCVSSLAFDLSVFDLLGTLCFGGTVRIASEKERADPMELLKILTEERITLWNSTPALLEQVLRFHAVHPVDLSALRLVYLSGDWIPLSLPAQLRRAAPGARLIAMGGATEATIWSNAFEVDEVDPSWKSIPYGHPIAGAVYHVLRPDGTRCAAGERGELCIGGGVLAFGYAGDPERTAASFVEDLLSDDRDPSIRSRGYRTGDEARVHPEGWIELLGRLDRQVKINGFRVELGEIETAVRSHPAVSGCVCVAMTGEDGRRWVRACVVVPQQNLPPLDQLREHAAAALPTYMVPKEWILLERFPLTSNGKIDVKRCTGFPFQQEVVEGTEPGRAARPSFELFQSLGLPADVPADVTLHRLGIDSLGELGVRLHAEKHRLCLPPGDLSELTISDLLAAPRRAERSKEPLDSGGFVTGETLGPVPLSISQRWLLQRRVGQPLHNGYAGWHELRPGIQREEVAERWLQLQLEEPTLRLRFAEQGGSVEQRLAGRADVQPVVDLGLLPDLPGGESVLQARGRDLILDRMDAQRGGGVLGVGQMKGGKHVLFLFVPHLVADGVSIQLVLNRLAGSEKADAETTDRFVAWCEASSKRRSIATDPPWKQKFLSLPWDRAGRWLGNDQKRVVRYRNTSDAMAHLPKELWNRCVQRSRSEGISADTLVLAAFLTWCTETLGCQWLAIDISGHGRDESCGQPGPGGALGYFSSVHPALLDAENVTQHDLVTLHRETYRVPWRGHGYESWRQSSRADRGDLDRKPPEIKYNVHPDVFSVRTSTSLDAPKKISLEPLVVPAPLMMAPQDPRAYLLNLDLMASATTAAPLVRIRFDHTVVQYGDIDAFLASIPQRVTAALENSI